VLTVFTYELIIQKHDEMYNLKKIAGIIESLLICDHAVYSTSVPLHAQGPYVKKLQSLTCGRYTVQIMFASWLTKKNFYRLATAALSENWNIFVCFSFSSSSCPTLVAESHEPYFCQGDMDAP
jgi:hypothetical protein